jgi:lipopolysaccharide/colanic/teichoic acid biosynthesis glycosyltransferase
MYPVVKCCIDIVVAGLGLIVLSPVLAVAIRMQMRTIITVL